MECPERAANGQERSVAADESGRSTPGLSSRHEVVVGLDELLGRSLDDQLLNVWHLAALSRLEHETI